ncbi:MAG: esterase-like activity of phytase family protein [Bacteroidota bacterium]
MKRYLQSIFLLGMLLIYVSCCKKSKEAIDSRKGKTQTETILNDDCDPLEHVQFIPFNIDTDHYLGPSGLTLKDDTLFYLSDNHQAIYYWKIDLDAKEIVPTIYPPTQNTTYPRPSGRKIEYESLTIDGRGNFIIGTEDISQPIIKVDKKGRASSHLGGSSLSGLSFASNALVEAICFYQDKLYLGIERGKRRLFKVNPIDYTLEKIIYFPLDNTLTCTTSTKGENENDLTGFAVFDNRLFGILRAERLIVEISEKEDNLFFSNPKSYRGERIFSEVDTSKTPKIPGGLNGYGKIEGIAMDSQYIYLIADNCDGARCSKDSGKRATISNSKEPKLYIFKNPY